MSLDTHTHPDNLEKYAFYWSLVRMVIAAASLFFGAIPMIYHFGGSSSPLYSLLPLAWLISGASSIYLLYRWHQGGMKIFGGNDQKDTVAFWIMIITGINLGYTAFGNNVGMSFVWNMPIGDLIFKATAIVYLIVAYYLWQRWNANGQHIVAGTSATPVSEVTTPPVAEVEVSTEATPILEASSEKSTETKSHE